jgi:hypothetical protein
VSKAQGNQLTFFLSFFSKKKQNVKDDNMEYKGKKCGHVDKETGLCGAHYPKWGHSNQPATRCEEHKVNSYSFHFFFIISKKIAVQPLFYRGPAWWTKDQSAVAEAVSSGKKG